MRAEKSCPSTKGPSTVAKQAEKSFPNSNEPSGVAKQAGKSCPSANEPSVVAKAADKSSASTNEPSAVAEVREFVEKARYGDATVLPRLKEILDNNPAFWQQAGDLGRLVRDSWAKLLAGESAVCHESYLRKAEAMRAELAGTDPTQAIAMMVDLVVGYWLEMQYAQLALASPVERLPQRKFHVHRAEAANKKFLASFKTLETVRKSVPVSQGDTKEIKVFEPAAKEAAR